MDVSGDTSPVATFCADLRRRWQESDRDLPSVAREIRISRTQLYAILNGEIKRPPDFEALVRPLILACGGTDAELADWRRRHAVLVGVHTELGRRSVQQPARRPAPPNPAQLPADIEGFTGRAATLAALDTAAARVVIITGTAGVGKTALAVHWAHRAAGAFPDGQLYVNLRGFDRDDEVMDAADAIRGFLDALGVEPQSIPNGRDAQAALYRSLTAGRKLLVVLDNARDADSVRPLLPGGPGVRTVITSRHRMTALVAEVGAYPVALDLPDEAEAVELLSQRTGPRPDSPRPDSPRPDSAEAAAAVVTACGQLPLALALVGARVRQSGFPLAAVVAELRRPGLAGLDEVRAVFSWSYRALSPPAARLFRLMGLAAGADIATAAVAALGGLLLPDARELLRELVDASLLTESAPGRYQLHDLLRAYARELADQTDASRTEPADERRAALTRLLDHYTHTAYQAELVLNPTRAPIPLALDGAADGTGTKETLDVRAALDWMGTERAVLLSALRQARDEGLDRQAWQLGWALDTFLYQHNRWQDEGAAWAVALSAATAMVDRPATAHAHRFLGVVAGRLERFSEAHDHMSRAAQLCRASGDKPGEAETEFVLSYVCWLQADRDRALDHAQRSLTLWTELGHTAWEGKASNAVGLYYTGLGAHQEALRYYERALARQQQAGDRANEVVARDNLGQAHHALGLYEMAAEHYRQGLRLARSLGDPIMEAQLTTHLGDTDEAIGDHASARNRWQHAHEILTDAGHPQAADVGRRLKTAQPPG